MKIMFFVSFFIQIPKLQKYAKEKNALKSVRMEELEINGKSCKKCTKTED